MAQKKDTLYQKEWKEVENLVFIQGLNRSALDKVNAIYKMAKAKGQQAQVIKTLLYRSNLEIQHEEKSINKEIAFLKKEATNTNDAVAKSILYSLIAQKYWEHFNNYRWQLYNRSNTVNFKKEDIETWSTNDFHKEITYWYEQSLTEATALKQTQIDEYNSILTVYNTKEQRPTIYDLLAQRALGYFMSDETYIDQPAYAFTIVDKAALGTIENFSSHSFTTKDSLSNKWKALLLFQDLVRFHKERNDEAALIDVNLQRIEYARNNGTIANEDTLYYDAVKENTTFYKNSRYAAQAWYLMAAWHNAKAGQYKPGSDTAYRWENVKALEICNQFLPLKDSTEGHYNLYNLFQTINAKNINLTNEQVNVPNLPFRTLVQYNNVSTLHYRIIKSTKATEEAFAKGANNDPYETELAIATRLPYLKQGEINLPIVGDYQQHSIEIKMEALLPGKYYLLASSAASFGQDTKLALSTIFVSNISYVNNGPHYFVLDRTTGQPLKNAIVKVWQNIYNQQTRAYEIIKTEEYTTDNNGYFKLAASNSNYRNIRLQIQYVNDELFMENEQYIVPLTFSSNDGLEDKTQEMYEALNSRAYFFTDRSIYRPGQTVYFKMLAATKDKTTKKRKLITQLPKEDYYIHLNDVNGKPLDSVLIKLNEYGTFAGSFKLPLNALTGNFTLLADYFNSPVGNNFSVEEYKRPTFYVQVDKPKGTYRLNDSVTVTGTAKAYSGANVDGAKIKYIITRKGRFIYPWLCSRWYFPSSPQTTITFGEAVTDANGKFTVVFKTQPDESISKEVLPIFDFEVSVDVTDRAGETRSSSTNVSVGYHSLNLNLDVKETAEADSLKMMTVSTTNIAGDKEPALVKVTIYPLKIPKQLVRKRYWQQPDQFLYSAEAYKKLFPNDEYKDESDKASWAKGVSVFSDTVNTKETDTLSVPKGLLKTGWYFVEATTKDKDGREIKAEKYVQLYSRNDGKFEGTDYLFTINENRIAQPNQPINILLGSSAEDIHLIQEIQHKPKPNAKEIESVFFFHDLNKEVRDFTITPTIEDMGGMGVNFIFVKDNRVFVYNQNIQVKEEVKNLNVEVLTYRDKLEPGNQEKWTLKITGRNKEAVAAEVLTSMYDASLDQFKPHAWPMPIDFSSSFYGNGWDNNQAFVAVNSRENYIELLAKYFEKQYPEINVYGLNGEYGMGGGGGRMMTASNMAGAPGAVPEMMDRKEEMPILAQKNMKSSLTNENKKFEVATKDGSVNTDDKVEKKEPTSPFKLRTNFNETAFFFPQLNTDKDGSLSFTFTMPDALTQWKWQILAHDKQATFGMAQKLITTQKTLMVQANAPRFMREGDAMEFSGKISNLSDKELSGNATLELLDAITLQPVNIELSNTNASKTFAAQANQSTAVFFRIAIPKNFIRPITWRIIAKAGQYADGEENTLPVLSNRMLVTESLPLYVRNSPFKRFEFTKLKNEQSTTLQHQSLTVEYTSNPVWYALQSLPYLLEYPYDCSEQMFNRFFANALASSIMNSNPKIKQVFEQWKKDTSALKSNLQKNEELKSIILQETPWLLQAENEAQQKKNLALLLDAASIEQSSASTIKKLQQMQMPSGGFPWFTGGREDRYITQYIITGIGRLQNMQAIPTSLQTDLQSLVVKAMQYLDEEMSNDYKNLKKYRADLKVGNTGSFQFQYLYMRSFFKNLEAAKDKEAYNYFYGQSKKYWVKQSNYFKAMIGEFLYRNNDAAFVNKNILPSLMESAVINEDAGMYWKENAYGWYWYQAPVEQQALMIEFVSEVYKQEKNDYLLSKINDMKTWLLRQKQTTHWSTTKSTADACYALLMNGGAWLDADRKAEIKLGDIVLSESAPLSSGEGSGVRSEAGTGYFKTRIAGENVTKSMSEVSVSLSNASGSKSTSPSWGAVYWQYFEDLDKITPAATPLLINKKLFTEINTDRGTVLQPINDGDSLKVGDKVKIRIEIKVDRNMEYVHLKDMRAASMEPVNVLSNYKWQDGLGYYENTKDASTNFFISYLPKGVYVFEYPVTITHKGNFSVGITTAQCMYAPEFNSHSEGIRINVGE